MRLHAARIPILAAVLLAAPPLVAQELADELQEPDMDQFVTVDEFDETMDEIDQKIGQLEAVRPGSRDFMVTGYATATYADLDGSASDFIAGFNPIFLFRPAEDLLFEGEFEFNTSEGELNVEYAQALWSANQWMTVGAGKFLSPLGQFTERYHPAWINPLPDAPLFAAHDGLVPTTLTGAQIRGGIRSGSTIWKYTVFVANDTQLSEADEGGGGTEGAEGPPVGYGTVSDLSQSKAFGGRVAVLPLPWLEVGFSAMSSSPNDTSGAALGDLTLYGADVSAHRETAVGFVRADAEFVTLSLDDTDTERWNGGYLQCALRPNFGGTQLSDFQGVVRYDWIAFPTGVPSDLEPSRWSFGVNYWIAESTVCKLAVERLDFEGEQSNSILLQLATGF